MFLQCPEWEHCNYIVHLLTVNLQCSSSGHWFSPPVKASSPGLEYVGKYTQRVNKSCPLRYADPEVIDRWMKEQVPYEVTIGKAPLDLSDEASV